MQIILKYCEVHSKHDLQHLKMLNLQFKLPRWEKSYILLRDEIPCFFLLIHVKRLSSLIKDIGRKWSVGRGGGGGGGANIAKLHLKV